MGKHVHHLIKESSETLAQIMKRISSTYVYYYNHKYGRKGDLFQYLLDRNESGTCPLTLASQNACNLGSNCVVPNFRTLKRIVVLYLLLGKIYNNT